MGDYRYIIAKYGSTQTGYRQLASVEDIRSDRIRFEKEYVQNGGFMTHATYGIDFCTIQFSNGGLLKINGELSVFHDIQKGKHFCKSSMQAGDYLGFYQIKNHKDLSSVVFESAKSNDSDKSYNA